MRRVIAPVAVLVAMAFALSGPRVFAADTPEDVQAYLQTHPVYISPHVYAAGKAHPGDIQVLQNAVSYAGSEGVTEKIALVWTYPHQYADTYEAARALRRVLDIPALVLVSHHGIGVTGDTLTLDQIHSIESRSVPICLRNGYAQCAAFAGRAEADQIKANDASSTRSAATFWIVILVLFGAFIAFMVWRASRRRRAAAGEINDLRAAASHTLSLADDAVGRIEAAGPMNPDVRTEYDQALGLRQRAAAEVQRGGSQPALIQANQDAAQAVLALQGVMRKMNIQAPLTSPLDVEGHRCFYCGHEDRPPYTPRTVDDGKGNSMQVEICDVCRRQLEQGQTPQMATVQYGGAMVPWWAVPNNPWYYAYGGPSWQYWLPFLIGMDVGGWFGGGWGGYGYGFGGPGVFYGDGGYGGGWGGQDISGGTQDPSTDMGAGDFGGWGDASGGFGGDAGGWGDAGSFGDAGGGDFGGGDFGGGDFGGGDFGGGGDGGWS